MKKLVPVSYTHLAGKREVELAGEAYFEEFTQLRRVDPPYTNWLLFSSTIESFLAKAGTECDEYRINSAIRKVEEW